MIHIALLVGPVRVLATALKAVAEAGYSVDLVLQAPMALGRLTGPGPYPCLIGIAAGLDGVGAAALAQAIRRLPGQAGTRLYAIGGTVPGLSPWPDRLPEAELVDLSALREVALLGPARLQHLLAVYREESAMRLQAIRLALAKDDQAQAEAMLHGWKGAAGSLGAGPLARLLATMNGLVRRGDLAATAGYLGELEELAGTTDQALRWEVVQPALPEILAGGQA